MKTIKIGLLIFLLFYATFAIGYADESVVIDSVETSPEYPITDEEFDLIVNIESISVTDAIIKLFEGGEQIGEEDLSAPYDEVRFSGLIESSGEHIYEISFWDVNFPEDVEITDVTYTNSSPFFPITVKVYEEENVAPVVNVSYDDKAYHIDDQIDLDGEVTDNNLDDSHTYYWEFVSTPAGSTAVIINDNQEDAGFVADVVGDYEISFTVTDERGLSDSHTFTVGTYELPVAVLDTNIISGPIPLTVHFSAEGSTGHDLKYSWDFDGDSNIDSTNLVFNWTYHTHGPYIVTLKVEDSGGSTDTANITIVVTEEEIDEEEVDEDVPTKSKHSRRGGSSKGGMVSYSGFSTSVEQLEGKVITGVSVYEGSAEDDNVLPITDEDFFVIINIILLVLTSIVIIRDFT